MVYCLGAIGLFCLIIVASAASAFLRVLFGIKSLAFAHTSLKISRNNYCLVRTGITWISFFQIMFVPSHFDDLESEKFDEAAPWDSTYVRNAGLHSEVRFLLVYL